MILMLYIPAIFFGLIASKYLKKKFSTPRLSLSTELFCFCFNGFFISLNLNVATYEKLFFYGDISNICEQYPFIIFLALGAALWQPAIYPIKIETTDPRSLVIHLPKQRRNFWKRQ